MFNHHRLKRKWGRGFKRASNFVMLKNNDCAVSNMRDFAWHRTKRNPFLHDEDGVINWKLILKLTILITSILATLYLGIFSPIFQIKTTNVSGVQRIDSKKIDEAVNSVLNYNQFIFFPGRSFFLVKVGEIKDILSQKFPLESIVVRKEYPNQLYVAIKEKIPAVIYDNGNEYSYLDSDGNQIEILKRVGQDGWKEKTQTTTSTDSTGKEVAETKIISRTHTPNLLSIRSEFGNYPTVYDESIIANLSKNAISWITEWSNYINQSKKIKPGYFIIKDELGGIEFKAGDGWVLKMNLKNNPQLQTTELDYILKEKINFKNISYIDLRFPGKVYWK